MRMTEKKAAWLIVYELRVSHVIFYTKLLN